MDYRQQLLAVADEFARATDRSIARVSTMVRNDGKFLDGLRRGRGCTMDTFNAAMQWFSDNWPASATWPEAVSRPPRRGEAA